MIATRSPRAPVSPLRPPVSSLPSPRAVLRDALRRLAAGSCAFVLLLGALLQPALAQNNLPALGDSDSADFSVGAERKIGDEIMREIHGDPDYMDDPLLLEYLQSVWGPLVVAARRMGNITADIDQRFAWQPFLVHDASVNAFALPGGFVGVHLGLIAITATPDELASVLGHEMSHVSQRHIARSISGSSKRSLVSLAALIIGLLAASRSNNPDAINAVVVGTQAASIQSQLNFSRDMEREADRTGFQVMVAAGFAPGGMAAMFEKMDVSSRLNDFGGFPYLRSHPLTVERIGEARSRAEALGRGASPRVSVLEHVAAQARARVLMDTRVDALRRWQGRDADMDTGSAADRLLNAAESAQASALLRDWSRADAAFAKALAVTRGSPNSSARAERAVVLMQAQSLLDRGAPAKAAEAIRPYAGGGSRPVILLSAQVALAENPGVSPDNAELKARAGELQTWAALHADDSLVWGALGQTWARLGLPLRSLRAEAESRYALGDLTGAVDRLRAAQRFARSGGPIDFIDASVVDSRLRDIDAQRRQIEIDRRTAGR
ncbi:MAG: M48 family metalloprotease [Burkholderiales bacterium]|nr:M48 family metalloprotease [Burkholderiales bacterium]